MAFLPSRLTFRSQMRYFACIYKKGAKRNYLDAFFVP